MQIQIEAIDMRKIVYHYQTVREKKERKKDKSLLFPFYMVRFRLVSGSMRY